MDTSGDEERVAPTEKKETSVRKMQQEALPWVDKYRPKDLNGIISHEDILQTLNKLIKENKLPHLLFYGPPGTGKTSCILAVARQIYGPTFSSMILELNASDDRGIGIVRKEIKDFASTRKLFSTGPKLVILDEADHMTGQAQAALRRVMEQFTKNTRFCLICNYVSKIIPALQSRCTRFRFAPIPQSKLKCIIDKVVKAENVNITPAGQKAVQVLSKGDLRKSLNILQSTHMAYNVVNENTVYMCTGNPLPKDINQIFTWLFNDEDFQAVYNNIKNMQIQKGIALQDIVTGVYECLHRHAAQLENSQVTYIYAKLSDIEYNLSKGGTESVQLGFLVGACQLME